MQLNCVNCGEPIAAKNINIHKTLAVCEHCNTVFNFEGMLSPAPEKSKIRKVKQPDYMDVRENDDGVELVSRWQLIHTPPSLNVLMFLWAFAAIVFPLIGAISEQKPEIMLFGLLVGFFPLYYFVSLLFNSTHLQIDDHLLTTGSKPLPWFDNKKVRLHQIKTLTYQPSKTFDSYYDLQAHLHDGGSIALMEIIPYEEAVFIAQQVNDYLAQTDTNEPLQHNLEDEITDASERDPEADMQREEQAGRL